MSVTIYEDRTNSFLITLEKDGITLTSEEMAIITKFEIKYHGIYYDSEEFSAAFVRDNTNGQVAIKPYSLGLPASRRSGDLVEFLIYDAVDNVGGLLWDQFTLIVKNDAAL